MFHMDRMAGWLQRACRMEFSHCCFRMGRPLLPIWISSPSGQNLTKSGQNQPKSPKVNMLKSGDVSFDFGFEWCLGSASGYVAKISMLILATYPSANSPSWPTCPGMFGTLFGTFGTFGTSGTFGTFLDLREHCSGTTQTPRATGTATTYFP